MIKPGSQNEKILNHLLTGAELTTMDAFRFFGCTRLAARILELKDQGYAIKRKTINIGKTYLTAYSL